MSQLLTIMPNKFLDLQDFQQSVVPISLLVKKSSFRPHWDSRDIFVLQTVGKKNDG